jgi:hypothetical protein
MFAGNVVQIGVSIVSTAELSNAARERPYCLTTVVPVLSLSKTCHMFRNAKNFFKLRPHSLAERTQISMLSHGCQIFFWADVTTAVVVWFAGHKCKNHNKWCI